ncbi:putative carboxylesterase 18 [Nymphaea thermarum]|nr:putative carboxylesterase 18 [Nymphaea thermarum]
MGTSEAAYRSLPWRTKLFCSVMGVFTDMSLRKDGTINRRLFGIIDFTSPASGRPTNGVSTADFTVDSSTGVWFRLFTPTGTPAGKKLPIIVFFHGGGFGFLAANSKAYDDVCRRFARRLQALVISVNYRLAPEHKFPTPYDDAEATLHWISKPGRLPESADLGRCFLAGDSAGANIVHHVGSRVAAASSLKEDDFWPLRIVGHVTIQPFFGGEERVPSELRLRDVPIVSIERTDFLWRAFLPEGANRDHPAANVTGPHAPTLAEIGLPRTLVVVGGYDPLQDRQKLYYDALKEAGIQARLLEYPDAIHAFYAFPELRESGELIAEIKSFIEEQAPSGEL